MKSKLAALLVIAVSALAPQQWQLALPGYRYVFPRDHFSHPAYQTEWWYYTGNLHAENGRRFGFELTFFRRGEHVTSPASAVWKPDEIYLAHLALSDIDGHEFYYTERLNRAGPGLAGADLRDRRYWNGNWQVRWLSLATGQQELRAVCERFSLRLDLKPEKPFVINGKDGVSQKGPQPGQASHYISYPLLDVSGELHDQAKQFRVSGTAWMDHEFFSSDLMQKDVSGWDWFAIQLNNNEELMLYRLRKKSGGETPYSSGTFVDQSGRAHFLDASQIIFIPLAVWRSPQSGAAYPVAWKISIPSLGIELTERPDLENQELFDKDGISPTYWEGAVTYFGKAGSHAVDGLGYLEMTGYDRSLNSTAPAW